MQVRRLERLEPLGWGSPCVAVGNFDGVHLGHQALLREVVAQARTRGDWPVGLTFDPHPARVLRPERAPVALLTFEQKARLLAHAGLRGLAVLPFDAALAALTPDEFAARVLRDALGARLVAVGENFRFGTGRAGGVADLRRLGEELGFELLALGPVAWGGDAVSSTRVREALLLGQVEQAGALLGRPYAVEGPVVAGDRRGRTLGFPTANVNPWNELLPLAGVYAARCSGPDGQSREAVVNVGRRPTFDGREVRLEAHLLDFEGDLYGLPLQVDFVARLRDEMRFPSAQALVERIRADAEAARRVLERAG